VVKLMSSVVFLSVMVLFGVGCMELGDDSTSQAVSSSYDDAVVTSQWGPGLEIHSSLSDRDTGTVLRAVYVPSAGAEDTWELILVEGDADHGEVVMSIQSADMTLEAANEYLYGHCRGSL
jgi:hypothetical protein